MKIVVFGAGGFLGGWICEQLSQARPNCTVVGCVRRWASAVRVARRGIEVRLVDFDMLPPLLDAADVVINSMMPASASEPKLVERLFSECVKARVRRFIYLSSAEIYGNQTGRVSETTTPAPVTEYGRAKAETERRLVSAAHRTETRLVVFRPSIIYGPFSEGWTTRFVERITAGRWRGLGPAGQGICNLVYAQDVARAAIAAATQELPGKVHVLNLNGSEVVTWNEYIERLGDALDVPGRVVPDIARFRGMTIAAEILRRAARVGVIRSFYRNSTGIPRATLTNAKAITSLYPNLNELRLMARDARYLADQAEVTLGFRPSVGLQKGIQQSVAWCRVHGIA
jgi:nucleoside-diphosphate-sugar epimerase